MTKIRKLILAGCLTLIVNSTNPALSQDFRGVFEMLSEDDMSDLFIVSNVLQRCSGLYGSLAKFLPKSDSQLLALKENSASLFALYFEKSVSTLNAKGQNTPENNLQEISQSISYYVDVYYRQLEVSQRNSGSIFSPWIKREFEHCNRLQEAVLR